MGRGTAVPQLPPHFCRVTSSPFLQGNLPSGAGRSGCFFGQPPLAHTQTCPGAKLCSVASSPGPWLRLQCPRRAGEVLAAGRLHVGAELEHQMAKMCLCRYCQKVGLRSGADTQQDLLGLFLLPAADRGAVREGATPCVHQRPSRGVCGQSAQHRQLLMEISKAQTTLGPLGFCWGSPCCHGLQLAAAPRVAARSLHARLGGVPRAGQGRR